MELIERVGGPDEVLKAQAHVWNHLFGFIDSMSLKCAVQLGIPDIINKQGHPMTLSHLVAALPISPARTAHVGRLMRLLVHSGIFAVQKMDGQDEGYVLTPPSMLLLKDTPISVSPFLLNMLDPVNVTPWHVLSTWFSRNESQSTPFGMANGSGLFDPIAQSPAFNSSFNEAMASDARLVMSIAVKECGPVFQGLRSLVDVGGGTGAVASAIADAFPHVKCTVLDLPHVIASVPNTKNIDMVAGDMFQSIPPADAVLLKWILHDWTDEECVKLLRRCKEAIPSKGGKVIIVEIVVNTDKSDYKSTQTQLFFDVMMIVLTRGRERDEQEWRKIFMDAGFSHCKFTPLLPLRSIIELYP